MDKKQKLREYYLEPIVALAVNLLTIFIVHKLDIPNPSMVIIVLMSFFTAVVSNLTGAISCIMGIAYALYFFSENHSFIHFDGKNSLLILIAILSFTTTYLMTAWIRYNRDKAFNQLNDVNNRLKKSNQMLKEEAYLDPLTELYNRRGGDEALQKELKNRDKVHAIVAVMDIDDFKNINDQYGHGAGDEALRFIAHELRKNFTNSILVRTGGDEFNLVDLSDLSESEEKINQFSKRKFRFKYQGKEITFTISCGYSFFSENITRLIEVLRQADIALYHAKIQGKHTACKYNGGSLSKEAYGFSIRDLTENLSGSHFIYKADNSEKIIFTTYSLLKMCGCQNNYSFNNLTGGTFRGFVYAPDLEKVEKSAQKQIFENDFDSVYCYSYRIKTTSGKIVSVYDFRHLVHDKNLGDMFYVTLYNMESLKSEK